MLGLLVLVLLAAFVLPVVFKPQILSFAKKQINANLNAQVDFSDVRISIFKGFPNLYVGLDELEVVNNAPFEGDTLAKMERFAVEVNLMSLFDLSKLEVREIILNRPWVHAHIDSAGHANWDIAIKKDSVAPQKKDTSDAMPPIGVKLSRFSIVDAYLAFTQDKGDLRAVVKGFNLDLKGDLAMERTTLTIGMLMEKVFFSQGGVVYSPEHKVSFDADVDAWLKEKRFVLQDNSLHINALELNFEGEVALPSDSVVLDVTFATPSTSFKSLLSLVPAVYMKDFSSIKTEGQLSLNGFARGVIHDKELPTCSVDLKVRDAMFQYPSFPERAENIHIDLEALYHGKEFDQSYAKVDLGLAVAGGKCSLKGAIDHPATTKHVELDAKGNIDLARLQKVVPMEGMELKGLADFALMFQALLSEVDFVKAPHKSIFEGYVKLKDVLLDGVLEPHTVQVPQLEVQFTPDKVLIPVCETQVGKSDVALKAEVYQFLAYLFSKETLRAQVNVDSKLLDMNDLFPSLNDTTAKPQQAPEAEKAMKEAADTASLDLLKFTQRCKLNFDAKVARLLFQQWDLTQVGLNFVVDHDRIDPLRLSCQALGGEMGLKGSVHYPENEALALQAAVDLQKVDVPQTVKTVTTVKKLLSAAEYMRGNVSAHVTLDTKLNRKFSPVLSTLTSEGTIRTSTLSIEGAPLFEKLGTFFNNDFVSRPSLDRSIIEFGVYNGILHFKDFDFVVKEIPVTMGGDVGLDKSLDLGMKMELPIHLIPKGSDVLAKAQSVLPAGMQLGNKIPVRVGVGGTTSQPKFTIKLEDDFKSGVKDMVKTKVQETVKEVKAQVQDKANELLAEARQQMERIMAEAERLAQEAEAQADKQAARLEAEAKSPIAKLAAKKAAEEVRRKGREAADKIRAEAQRKADAVMAEAQRKVDSLGN